MVPVGGSVVASSNPEFIKKVSQIYPGIALIHFCYYYSLTLEPGNESTL